MKAKAHIYACYLPGSTTPDYIGSHMADPPARSHALAWRYSHGRYLGQGAWIDPHSGEFLLAIPAGNRSTRWAALLLSLSPADRAHIRVEVLAAVPAADRRRTEAHHIRAHRPPYNAIIPQAAEERRAKYNAYQRAYQRAYMQAHPERAQAKRDADRERARARRARAKAARQGA